jgi:hypothetical protein
MKKREAMSPALHDSRHCPSFWPTRLADGLELEVFVVELLIVLPAIRPCFAIYETLVPPRS